MNKKYKLALKVILITAAIIAVKLILNTYTEFSISLNSLFLSAVGGTIFLMGFILAGVASDYKESEKIPGDIAASIENMHEEGRYAKSLNKDFDLRDFRKTLAQIIADLKSDISGSALRKKSASTVSRISDSLLEMEKLKIPTAYINRIKADRDGLKKSILRIYHIKETSFVPAAYAILELLAVGIIAMLLFIKLDGLVEPVLIPGLITFFLLYMIFLIKDMDDPFDVGGYVGVDLFLLDDLKEKLDSEKEGDNRKKSA